MSYGMYNQDSERPTSRVTRPPGGSTSISFGSDAPPPRSTRNTPEKAKPQVQDTKPQEAPTASPQQRQQPSSQPSNINAGKSNKAVHTSSKVLNPPGGKTSISFF